MTIIEKQTVNSKNVKDYWVEKFNSGIYSLVFNTKKRWIEYHQADDSIYLFKDTSAELDDDWEEIEIEEFLPKETTYLHTVNQNKDQVEFYFIPFNLVDDDGDDLCTVEEISEE